MNRFILYSGLVHGALFMGALTYMATGPQNAQDPSVESVVELELPTAATRNVPAVEAPQPVESQESLPQNAEPLAETNKQEVRERKVRASLPPSPSVPRIVERVEKVTGEKLATSLPEKKVQAAQMAQLPTAEAAEETPVIIPAEQENLPEMGTDAPSLVADENESDLQQAEASTLSEMDAIAAKHLEELNEEKSRALPIVAPLSDDPENSGTASQKLDTPEGASNTGSNDPSQGQAKSLGEFRQKAGNKRPDYDLADRREGRQGTVVFMAYVTASGQPKDFQMISSSGHRALDLKTLKALKSWQFVAGQEGWVEIPFRWDLKGGVQEAPSTLRRINRTAN